MAAPNILYTPSKWGAEFHATPFDEVLGAGSAGPGKTTVLIADPLYQVLEEHRRCTDRDHPHPIVPGTSVGHALHLRRKFPMLQQTIERTKRWFPLIDPGAKFTEGRNTPMWTFTSGYKYQFGHCNERGDYILYVGNEYTHIAFDELTQFESVHYEEISARCRTSDPVLSKMLKVRSASNPATRFEERGGESIHLENPFWVREMFVDPHPAGRKILATDRTLSSGKTVTITRFYLPAKLSDNPDPIFRENYEKRLLGRPVHIRKAYLEGDWYFAVGSFFDPWSMAHHTCRPFNVPRAWSVFRSMDWGYKAPGCVHWWALDPEGTLYCIRELTFQLMEVEDVAKDILKVEERMGLFDPKRDRKSKLFGPADTQIWEERGDNTESKASRFAKAGVLWGKANKKSRAKNAALLYGRIADHAEYTKTPGVVFFDTCAMAIKTIPATPRSKTNPEEPADNGPDHWLDSCLAPGALVTTDRGRVRLDCLLATDRVLSSDGRFWPCSGGRMIRRQADTTQLSLSNGENLRATPDHVLLCSDGVWRRVDQLHTGLYLVRPWIRKSSRQLVKGSWARSTTSAESTFSVTAPASTGLSGRPAAERPSRADSTCTTRTATGVTTQHRISKSCPGTSTWSTISKRSTSKSCARMRHGLRSLLWPGTKVMLASLGTVSTRPKASRNQGLGSQVPVKSAVRPSLTEVPRLGSDDGAVRSAPRNTGAVPELTTRSEFAPPVGVHSWSAGTAMSKPVRGTAVEILGMEKTEKADVWCTTVPGMAAFVADGVLVSNCMYACAYASFGESGLQSAPKDDDDLPSGPARVTGFGYGSTL